MANRIATNNNVSKSSIRVKTTSVRVETEELELNSNKSKRRKIENSTTFEKVENADRKWCHQCRVKDRGRVIECQKCQTKKYCVPCITKWYPNASEDDFINACPVCRDNCNCTNCLRRSSPKSMQGYSCSIVDKIQYSKYILQKVFPLMRRLNEEQLMEKEIEAKYRGLSLSELQLKVAKLKVDERMYCDNCGADVFDFHRSCACGYNLCLVCCRDFRWKSHIDGSIPCPQKHFGGCDDGILELNRIMPDNFVVNMLEKARGLYEINKSDDIPRTNTKCSMCYDFCNEPMQDKCNSSNLYSPRAKNIQPQDMKHFQLHWSKGEPVIVSDVLSTSSGLSWEPTVLWRAFRDITKIGKHSGESGPYEVNAIDCSDWSRVTVSFLKFCTGYSDGLFKTKGCPMIMKLEDWKPFLNSQEQPRHFVEFISCLPFQDYTHPENGYLNVAVKLPDLSFKPDMGPRMDISYGVKKELKYGDSVTKLRYGKSDTVNVLTHRKSAFDTSINLNKTKMVKRKDGYQDEALVCDGGLQTNKSQEPVGDLIEAGALWDIFRRQDIPKLEKYLRNHSADFELGDGLSVELDDRKHLEPNSDDKGGESDNNDNIKEEEETEPKPEIFYVFDPEFSDFVKNRSEESFKVGQIWACYDTYDAMPRFYAYIKNVVSRSPVFKLQLQWLKPDPGNDDEKKWMKKDLPVSCGYFKPGRPKEAEDILMFSHFVAWEEQKGGLKAGKIKIIPRKGETWALFRNWSMNWHSSDDYDDDEKRNFEYEFVEILSDYDETAGVRIWYLEKVKGFVCLFKRKTDGEMVIAGRDRHRFAHMVPSYKMSGEEREGVPNGSFELDPAALPLSTFEQVSHPIHDREFYLNKKHKKKLKEEFGIEPWTFTQKLGDAVFIPAGCPYQVRNLKSNMKVEVNFISPENLVECIRLQREVHMLPDNHRAKQDKLNIEKMMVYALDQAIAVLESNGPNDDLYFAKMPEILQGDSSSTFNHTNGWLPDTDNNHEPTALQDSDETVGLWRGNAVGLAAKELLEAIEDRFPNTFQGVQIRFKRIWLSTLKEFHEIIKGFLETAMDELTKEQITSLGEDLNELEKFGFDLSWAHKRLDMVEKLKFENDHLRQEFMVLEESLEPLKERLVDRRKQFVEAREMLEKAQLEYDKAKDARNNMARKMVEIFGNEYDHLLKGQLGFGLLLG